MKLITVVLAFSFSVFAPQPLSKSVGDCEVSLDAIKGEYTGDCKKGQAHGEGKAVGEDTYEGSFKKGLPHGKGVYTWANGDVYTGEFKKGIKDGQGSMTFADPNNPPIKGYWIEDEFIGTEKNPFKIINKSVSVTRASFKRLESEPNQIVFKFNRLGKPAKCRSLELQGGFGVLISETEFARTIKVHTFPMQGAINFSAMNLRDVGGTSGGGEYVEGNMEFSINQAGSWEVTLEVQDDF